MIFEAAPKAMDLEMESQLNIEMCLNLEDHSKFFSH